MKLLRYGPRGSEKPGLLDNTGMIRDLSGVIDDVAGAALLPEQLAKLKALDPASLPVVDGDPRLGACVSGIGNFLCIGRNYAEHAEETGAVAPPEPILFTKVTSALAGPNDDIIIPYDSHKTDWEVKLGVIIGRPAKRVKIEDALRHVAGYCAVNDVSERTYQLEGTGQWVKGKSCDTFGPIGPWLVTPDEVGDPQDLHLWLAVDGHRYQDGHTSKMIFGVAYLISYLSHFFTLNTGDLLSTGTPPGVGLGQRPEPIFLKGGQLITLEVEKLGSRAQRTVQEAAPVIPSFSPRP